MTVWAFRQTLKCLLPGGVLLLAAGSAAFGAESIRVQTFKTHSRLILKIDEGITTQWKNSSKGFELLLKGATLSDLGAPFGEEPQWMAQFRELKDPRVGDLTLSESAAGVRIQGTWKYPKGAETPAHPEMETFEFRDKSPQYVVDFWVKRGPTVAQEKLVKAEAARRAAAEKAQAAAKARTERRLASHQARVEREDLINKFCREPIAEKSDVFLPFLPFHEKVDFSRWLATKAPDSNFTYFVPTGKTREAQYVRLALDLYRQGKAALTLRTLDFLDEEFPNSDFRHDMKFLRANALVKLGHGKQADEILARLMVEAKSAAVSLHAGMYLAGNQIEKGSALAALESFLWLIQYHPEHRLAWVFRLGAAESLYSMKQTERAAKEYQWIVENAPNQKAKAQAAFRLGDLYLDRFQYEQALAAYYQALSHFPDEASSFPSVYVNRGEVLYQLGQQERAQQAFEQFLTQFGSHPAGWRATFRLGEIFARKEGLGPSEKARSWFYQTINHYPTSPGATVARLRLLPCGDHGGFTYESMERFLSGEAENYDGRGEISVRRYRDFKRMAYIRALITMNREDQAVSVALKEMQQDPTAESRAFLTKIVSTLFRKSILKLLDAGKKYEALAFYQEKKDLISRGISEDETDLLHKLSLAASDLRLGSVATQLAEAYAKAIGSRADRTLAAEGSAAAEQDLDTRLRNSDAAFAKAKALWVSHGMAAKDELRPLLESVREESQASYEKELILALMDEAEENFSSAIAHAAKAQLLKRGETPPLRIEAWMASLEVRAKNPRTALTMYRNLEKRLALQAKRAAPAAAAAEAAELLGIPVAPGVESVVLTQAELLETLKEWGEAATAYGKAVGAGWGSNRALYGYGNALLRTGQAASVNKGWDVIARLAASKEDDFWKKLASEMLANAKKSNQEAKEGGR